MLRKVTEPKLGYGEQHATISWWPKANVWETSGLNLGYWTPTAEKWFLRRLTRLHNGTEQAKERAKGTKPWKKSVKYDGRTKDLVQCNRSLAERFIETWFDH